MREYGLTPKQQEVLIEACKGKSNKEIARALNIAEATVKLHFTEIFRALGVKTRTQAIIKASEFPIKVENVQNTEPLTDLEILKTFTDVSFNMLNKPWSEIVLKFSRMLLDRNK